MEGFGLLCYNYHAQIKVDKAIKRFNFIALSRNSCMYNVINEKLIFIKKRVSWGYLNCGDTSISKELCIVGYQYKGQYTS